MSFKVSRSIKSCVIQDRIAGEGLGLIRADLCI